MTPPGALRARALRATLNFLRHHNSSRDQRNLWFTHASRLLDLARGTDRDQVLDTLMTSGEPALAAYAEVARLQPVQREMRRPARAGFNRPSIR